MPFGLSSSPKEFERRLEECLEGLERVEVIADDIVIYGQGETEEEAQISHDQAFRALLDHCRQKNLRLNPKKLKFNMTSIGYMGHVISPEGLAPDPQKVRAIRAMPHPTDVQSVQRLLGMVNYLAKFLPRLSTVCETLRRLTDRDAQFDWMPHHEDAFAEIKRLLTEAPILKFYDPVAEVVIECDSSEVGLGAALLQDGRPVAYASRALTQTERNYAQIEKECLAIVFATSRFEQYILGKKEVTILTDHKPLVSIFNKSILTSPKRLQRMRLRLQKYPLKVHYKPGPQMFLSDTLSRASLPNDQTIAEMPEYLIYSLQMEEALMSEIAAVKNDDAIFVTDQRLEKVKQETAHDITLQTLMSIIQTGWPDDKNKTPLAICAYWPYRNELVASNGLVYRGTRLIIPTSMRSEMVKRAHASHMGIHYTLNTARDIMYWPGMPTELTDAVNHCNTCQEAQSAQPKEPMMTYPLPKQPWEVVASDCFELSGRHYSIFVDVYSGYIELCELEDLTTGTLIDKTKQVFATHGIPVTLITDNGPNYAAKEFASFARAWDVQHITSSPHHSKSNGRAEAAVKTVKNIMKKSQDGDVWKSILEWRNTITPGANSSPVQRLMSRRTRSFLPCHPEQYSPRVQEGLTDQVIMNRRRAKKYHDRGAKELPNLVIGQPVRAKARPQKTDSPWLQGQVTDKVAPRRYLVEVNGKNYRRNCIHLRDAAVSVSETAHQTPQAEELPECPVEEQAESAPTIPPAVEMSPPPSTAKSKYPVTAKSQTVTTRAGRVSKPPARYKDFVQ